MDSTAIEQKVHGAPLWDCGKPKKIVYLVGTVHVSDNSARKVREIISAALPDFVCLELDLQRFQAMQEMAKERARGAEQKSGAGPENREPGAQNPRPKTEDPLGEGGQFRYSGGALHGPGPAGAGDVVGGAKKKGYTAAYTSPVEMLTLPGMLKWMQQRIGEEFGVMPGQEMVAAVEAARGYGLKIALIDRPVQQTIARMWNSMGFKEKMKLFSYIVAAMGFLLLKPLFGKARGDFSVFGVGAGKVGVDAGRGGVDVGRVGVEANRVEINEGGGVEKKETAKKAITTSGKKGAHISMGALEKGEGVAELMEVLKGQFPAVHKALVEERNIYMCNNIAGILQKVDKLVVVVGMGHVGGMRKLLEGRGFSVSVM